MGHQVETEDLVLLRSIDARLSLIEKENALTNARSAQLADRMNKIEAAFTAGGGRVGVILERLLVAVATALLGYQTFTPPRQSPAPTALTESIAPVAPNASSAVVTSTQAR